MKTILLITSLTFNTTDVRAFDTYLACVQFAQQHAGSDYKLQCVPAPEAAVNKITQNFYSVSRLIAIFSQQNQ